MLQPRREIAPDAAAAWPFRTIVLGTDFSPAVGSAEEYAALLAEQSGGELVIVHAFTLEQPALETEAIARRASAQREDLTQLLNQTLADRRGATRLLCEAGAADAIRRVSAEYAPSLVVIGTHGPGAVERRLLGSTAEGILRSIAAPVLTVGPHVAPPTAPLTFRRILFATDYSEAAARAEVITLAWGKAFEGHVDVLHATADSAVAVHHRILERAWICGADLIVLGAHHHSHLSMHARTGPAFHVVLGARCPVLTVSGSAAQEAR